MTIQAHIDDLVAAAPPLTSEQSDLVALVFGPTLDAFEREAA